MPDNKLNGTEALLRNIRDEARGTNDRLGRIDGHLEKLTTSMHGMLDLMSEMNTAMATQNALVAEALKEASEQRVLLITALKSIDGRLGAIDGRLESVESKIAKV